MTGCGARSTSLWVHRNLFWQLSRDGNLHSFGISHDNLSKTILQGTLEGGRRRGRQRKCWIDTSRSGHPCTCQNCSQGPPAENIGRGSLLNRPSSPPDGPIGQGTELIPSIQPILCALYLTFMVRVVCPCSCTLSVRCLSHSPSMYIVLHSRACFP